MFCFALREVSSRGGSAPRDGRLGEGRKLPACACPGCRSLAWLGWGDNQTQSSQGVASPSTISVPLGLGTLPCGPRVACCCVVPLFLDGRRVCQRLRAARIWRRISTARPDFYGLTVLAPFETRGRGSTDAEKCRGRGSNLGFQGTGRGNLNV